MLHSSTAAVTDAFEDDDEEEDAADAPRAVDAAEGALPTVVACACNSASCVGSSAGRFTPSSSARRASYEKSGSCQDAAEDEEEDDVANGALGDATLEPRTAGEAAGGAPDGFDEETDNEGSERRTVGASDAAAAFEERRLG
jgi:hypothetical protein